MTGMIPQAPRARARSDTGRAPERLPQHRRRPVDHRFAGAV